MKPIISGFAYITAPHDHLRHSHSDRASVLSRTHISLVTSAEEGNTLHLPVSVLTPWK